jgi:DNA modification methylase
MDFRDKAISGDVQNIPEHQNMRELEDKSVHFLVTSTPYFNAPHFISNRQVAPFKRGIKDGLLKIYCLRIWRM